MPEHAVQAETANVNQPTILLGARGTLEPDPTYDLSLLMFGERWMSESLPPLMEQTIEPLLAKASGALAARVEPAHLLMSGKPLPLQGLLLLLKDRLADLLTFAIAEDLEIDNAYKPFSQSPFYRRFPALTPLLDQTIAAWANATALFLSRLHTDERSLARFFGLAVLPPLESISATASDIHPGAGVVLRLAFQGGPCLYYKPRPVSGEWLWHELLRSIAQLDPALTLPAPRILCSDARLSYGWAESMLASEAWPARGLDSSASNISARSYWHCAGALLCLAQHTCMTDLHLGNILATAAGPCVLDAECLATPQTKVQPRESQDNDQSLASAFGSALDSLRATGLLSRRNPLSSIDTSGFFGHGGEAVPVSIPRWAAGPEGRYRLVASPAVLAAHGNALAVSSQLSIVAPVCEGYRHAAEALLQVRPQLVDSRSKWVLMLETVHAPRVMLRDTLNYGLLRSRSLMPDQLRSTRERKQSILAALSAANPRFPKAIVHAEARALLSGCIPRLHILPGTRTLTDSFGAPLAAYLTTQTPAQAVRHAMEALSPDRLERHLIPALLAAFI